MSSLLVVDINEQIWNFFISTKLSIAIRLFLDIFLFHCYLKTSFFPPNFIFAEIFFFSTTLHHPYCTHAQNPEGGYRIFSKKSGKGVHDLKKFKGNTLFVFFFALLLTSLIENFPEGSCLIPPIIYDHCQHFVWIFWDQKVDTK